MDPPGGICCWGAAGWCCPKRVMGAAPWAPPSLPREAAMVWGGFSLPCGPGVPGPQGHHCATPQGHPTYLRLLPRPPPAPLLRRVLLPLGGQGLAGFGAGFAHRPSRSGEEEREEEEGQSALGAHAGAAPCPPPWGLQPHPSQGCSCILPAPLGSRTNWVPGGVLPKPH